MAKTCYYFLAFFLGFAFFFGFALALAFFFGFALAFFFTGMVSTPL
jgi:hypothetical protein